jgi:quinol monooxygenase YgiN
MPEIVVVGAFAAKPGKENDLKQALEALVAPTHAEDGCILYALHRGSDDPAKLAFIERWASRDALDAHLESDHIKAVLERADELWGENGDITVYEAVPGGEERKGTIAGHAGG